MQLTLSSTVIKHFFFVTDGTSKYAGVFEEAHLLASPIFGKEQGLLSRIRTNLQGTNTLAY
jgi:hypothetical protein